MGCGAVVVNQATHFVRVLALRASTLAPARSACFQLPAGGDAQRLFNTALDNGIGIAPGPLFSSNGGYGDYLRLTCGLPWDERLAQGMVGLGKLVHENVVNGKRGT